MGIIENHTRLCVQSLLKRLIMDTQSLVVSGNKFKSTQLFIIAGTILMTMVVSVMCIGLTVHYEVSTDTVDTESVAYWKTNLSPEQEVWFEKGAEELRLSTKVRKRQNVVENAIIFVVDGVSSEMLAKSRFREQQNVTNFIWDSFPYVGSLRLSCGYTDGCDLGTVGTSLFGGVKTTSGLLGVDNRVAFQNCSQAFDMTHHVSSIFQQAHYSKLRTGFVTTQRVTDPLLSSLYAHSSDTQWECDAAIPKSLDLDMDCIDVATQLMLGNTGQAINAIMGGGKQTLVSRLSNDSEVDSTACDSKDKRNLLQDWKYSKLDSNEKFELLETDKELNKFNGTKRDFVLGVFSNTDLKPKGPKLKTMLMKSLDVLIRNSTGYIAIAQTSVESEQIEDFQKSLLELEDVINRAFEHPGFSVQSTLVLVAFMNLPSSTSNIVVPEDIRIYATGPNAYLFHKVHEETYLAHAISYSLKIGPFNLNKSTKG